MSEQAAEQIQESTPSSPPEQTQEAVTQTPVQTKNDYTDFVDLSDLPEEKREAIEGRFKHLSRLMKKNERRTESQLSEYKKLMEEQSNLISELSGNMGVVVGHLQQEKFASTEAQLQQKMQQAWETGDTKAYVDAQDKLMDIKVQQRLAQQQKPTQQTNKTETQQQAYAGVKSNGEEIAQQAFDDGDIGSEDKSLISAWQQEKDESGIPVRPWTQSRTPDNPMNDPQFRRAYLEMAVVFDDEGPFANLSMDKKLAELDRRMGTQQRSASQPVLGSNLTNRGKSAKITLSQKAQDIAVKTKFAGPGKTNDEHIAAYRNQIEQIRKGRQ